MLIQTETGFIGGLRDVILILHNTETGRYHVAFYQERPFPGGAADTLEVVRLGAKLHHTTGVTTIEDALTEVERLSQKIKLPDANIWRRPDQHVEFQNVAPEILLVPATAFMVEGHTIPQA
jgi:hypothetical protein